MPDYIKMNSKRCHNENIKHLKCSCHKFQSYNPYTFGKDVKLCSPITCNVQQICNKNNLQYQQYVINQQNLYAMMRRHPEKFPITPYVQDMNLTPQQQRAYSNLWYRQFGTSQARGVNDIWGGFYVVGSEVPYTN